MVPVPQVVDIDTRIQESRQNHGRITAESRQNHGIEIGIWRGGLRVDSCGWGRGEAGPGVVR